MGQSAELLRSDKCSLLSTMLRPETQNTVINRQQAIRRLEKQLKASSPRPKSIIWAINRLLKMEGEITVALDNDKVAADSQ